MIGFPLVLTAAEMRAADAAVARALGVPTARLMESAGRGVAEIVRHELGGAPGEVAIVCGAGSNGGDGFVAARHLAEAGARVRVLLAAPRSKVQGDALQALGALEAIGGVPLEDGSGWTEPAAWRARLVGARVVVDAIFGTGFRGPLAGVAAAAL
ncbi:MAG TPA: NAD(P)H-hydrate epimerase, partial [Polyangia bacterium]|nr:NAD(P)H-hydrate epimerase [Polyangia bacterium]